MINMIDKSKLGSSWRSRYSSGVLCIASWDKIYYERNFENKETLKKSII